MRRGGGVHVKGRTYNGKLCYGELTGAKDAYEWSFVAVPAQREAGVIKGMGPTLKELVRGQEKAREELERLEKEAMVGRRYLEELRLQVVRLAAVSEPSLEVGVVRSMAQRLEEEELTALKTMLERRSEEKWSGGVQLTYPEAGCGERGEDRAFMV